MSSSNYKSEVQASGDSVAPGANAVIADTGVLPFGKYDIDITVASLDSSGPGKGISVEHRNSANAATLNRLGGTSAACSDTIHLEDFLIQANERIRAVVATQAGAALSEYIAFIRVRQKA